MDIKCSLEPDKAVDELAWERQREYEQEHEVECGYTLEFVRRSPYNPKYDKYYFSKNISSRKEAR